MAKTIKIKSKRTFLYDTAEQIASGRYKYLPASCAVTVFTKAATIFNKGIDPKCAIVLVVKYTNTEDAKIKLKGSKQSVNTFINRVLSETELLEHFNIRL